MTTTETRNPIQIAVEQIAEAIATEVLKDLQQTIVTRIESEVDKYVDSQDFRYTLEDAVRGQIEEHVSDYVDGVSLSVRID